MDVHVEQNKNPIKTINPDITLSIDPELKQRAPNLKLGVVLASVVVEPKNDSLWLELSKAGAAAAQALGSEGALASTPAIAAAREAYKACGKEPSRYRVSSEALIRRVINGKSLYRINSVVDVDNLISIESRNSVGVYDFDKIQGEAIFRIGKPGENYNGIGKETINIEGLPVFSDNLGPFGSPTSDSQRSMVTQDTRKIMLVIIAFGGDLELSKHIARTEEKLTEYASAREIHSSIVT